MSTGGGGYPRHGRNTPKKATLPFAARPAEPLVPPPELSDEEAAIWIDTINRMPEHFVPSPPLVVNLCRHIRLSRWFARQQQALEEQLPHAHNEERARLLRDIMALSRAQNGASRVIALLCARLKLTPITPHRARPTEQRPWDIPGDADEELPQ